MDEQLTKGRRRARRVMAWVSFGMLTLEAGFLIVGTYAGGPTFSQNVQAVTPLFISIMWAQVAVISVYLGTSLIEAINAAR